ncbi:putative CENPB DNA-binding domain-containing protein 1 [Moschus berezovskii]|uniref:putative CENPB DNA-binding domain-containing protein 1 n=1 Tax=Moschus berezovskii TaxID=68408 RepID=UPI002443CF33|nr:putative CENPB DNA-binding domain-containing protein 1 [Moschus berezovskii]
MSGKRSLNAADIRSAKREWRAITLDVKLEVLRRFEVGEKLSQIAKALGLAVSTVATIRDNKDKIKASSQIATPLRASRLTRHQSAVMETMKRLLRVWLEDHSQRNVPLSITVIQKKAKSLFDDLQREQGESAQTEKFTASKGWFVRFKERHCLPHFKMNIAAPAKEDEYPKILKSIIQEGEYTPQQVFNVDETDGIAQLQQNIVILAKSVAVGEVGEPDVDQLLQSHKEGLSNEELMQLEQEPAGEEGEGEEAAPALRQLTTRELSAAFLHFEAGLQVLTSNSPDAAWKLQVSRAINDAISCYRDLYSEKE